MDINMKELLDQINELKNNEINDKVCCRIDEFKKLGKSNCSEIFKELCFCILTANFSAERAIKIQKEINDGFLHDENISDRLKSLGYRFPNSRGRYICEARRYKEDIKNIIKSFDNSKELRAWVAKNVKGLGYKESSHFLRNIGFTDLAIIDSHIIDILVKNNLIERPKSTPSKRKYLEIEDILKDIAKEIDLNLAELDLYLWYLETNKVLK
ncbi:MAG: N-glycosylase/DNA lyase [Candidatus Lokiarchaeota archaeon]|nr:N-glycosylase/DNA lyase [Candidatus Lokiarchaeota archaeon]